MITVKVDAFELRKLVLDTNMPIPDDLWKFLNDIDLEHTDRVVFITKDGKEAEFVKTGDATVAKNETVGHWVEDGDSGWCSECKCDMPMYRDGWEWKYTKTNYCPNCGAKMDEVRE